MKVPTHHGRETVSMAELSTNPARGITPGMSMDKGRKTQGLRRTLPGGHKTFGVPLTELVHRAPHGYTIPFFVKKVCTFLEHNGMDQEGIFRVNGSQKIIEKLKLQFDHHGHANLEEDGDVMAVAGLLKLFLRELPESVIPEHMTRRFVNIQEEFQRNSSECVLHLKSMLNDIPSEHYDLLKHIVRFLAVVSCNEPVNRMSPMALAIVFGPNLFRCGKGFLALKDQGTTNQIVYRFIADYDHLFKDMNEDSPAVYWERKKHNLVPPRPPPPKFQTEELEVPSSSIVKPIPSPRKSKMKNHEGSWYTENEDQDHSESSLSSKGRNSHSHTSPSFSDDEMTGRLSPFHLDSDSGFSLVESPVPSARTSEFVDKAIKATVIGHMFGDECSLLNASIDTTIREDHSDPVSESTQIGRGASNGSRLSTEGQGVLDRVKQIEQTDMQHFDHLSKPVKQRPISKAFEMFEKKGMIITQMPESGIFPQSNGVERTEHLLEGQPFEDVRRNSDTLQNFKRPAGPQNRRSPSRKTRSNSSEADSEEMDEQEIEVIPNGNLQHSAVTDNKHNEHSDVNHNNPDKTRIAFLDIRHDTAQNKGLETSPEKSPTGNKAFVPPLDFSTLHENVGSQDAIPANKAGSVSYHRAKQLPPDENNDIEDDDDFEHATPSPRSHKVKRKAGPAMEDDDFPPFSQADQDQYKLHSHGSTDDELTSKMKVQMRKVQTLKKKIRHFEEMFERENGYKPSHAEKAAKPEIKKFMLELSKARKEAKKLKEEAEMGSRSRHGSGASSTGERMDPPELPPTMSRTLDGILKRLQEKRRDTSRPEVVEMMNSDQVQEEKLAVQKALLHFEGIHGRPKSKDEKDLMRPLYDRYRLIKRMLSRQPISPRRTLELQTVPEDQPMIDTDSQDKFTDPVTVEPVQAEPIRVPTALIENNEEVEEDYVALGTMDFAVTRDLSILKTRPKTVDNQGPHSPKARRKLELLESKENKNLPDSNLHELTIPELQDELLKSRNIKKKLRKTLREFEENFTKRTSRKVGREDRMPMQAEYNEYKQLKARLKLLEALLSKHRPTEV